MANVIFLPPEMPMRGVISDVPSLPIYQGQDYDKEPYNDIKGLYEDKVDYFLKRQQNDRFGYQFATNAVSIELQLRNADGSINPQDFSSLIVSRNITGDEVDGETVTRYQVDFKYSAMAVPDGRYFFVIKASFVSGDQYILLEPFYLRAEWPDTLLFQYTHNQNDNGVIWTMNPNLSQRVEGNLTRPVIKTVNTEFTTQGEENRTLDSKPYRMRVVNVGMQASAGVPYWLLDNLTLIVGLSAFSINGRRYTVEPGKEWDRFESQNYNLQWADLEIRYYQTNDAFIFNNDTVPLFATGTYPYVLREIRLSNGINSPTIVSKIEIRDAGEETALITALNNSIDNDYGLRGIVSVTGGNAVYVNAVNEQYTLSTSPFYPNQLTKYLRFDTNSDGGTRLNTIKLKGSTFTTAFIGWGDGTPLTAQAGVISSTALMTFTHTYTADGDYIVNIYHDDKLTDIETNNATLTGVDVVDIAGQAPAKLLSLTVRNGDISELDLSFLQPAYATLGILDFQSSRIQTIVDPNNVFAAPGGQQPPYWTNLLQINFSNNRLNAASVELFVVHFYASIWGNGGTMDFSGQSPAYAPTTPTTNYAGYFAAAGWVITLT